MKITFKAISNIVGTTMKGFGEMFKSPFAGIAAILLGCVNLSMNGVDIPITIDSGTGSSTAPVQKSRDDLAKEAIEKLVDRAKAIDFDSQRILVAKDIRDIALHEGAENAKTSAINGLSYISSLCDFDSARAEIMAMIKEIAVAA